MDHLEGGVPNGREAGLNAAFFGLGGDDVRHLARRRDVAATNSVAERAGMNLRRLKAEGRARV